MFGMIQRGGEVVIRMLADVKQTTIKPIIEIVVRKGSEIFTDEYNIYARLEKWGYKHKTVCHGAGEYARDESLPSRRRGTGTAFMRSTSIPWKAFGRCSDHGCVPIAESHKKNCLFTSHSLNSLITSENEARRCYPNY